jgi:exodeoxyribonuclease V alpha subunit
VLVDDPFDVRFALRATGLLRTFNQAGVLSAADVHVAQRLGRLGEEASEPVQLAIALAVRAVRLGSVCIAVEQVSSTIALEEEQPVDVAELPWPEPGEWLAACERSPLIACGVDGDPWRPVRLIEGLLYLDRYWRQEQLIRRELDRRAIRPRPQVDPDQVRAGLHRLWPHPAPDGQRLAAAVAALSWLTVLAGGPGTGKTTTVARLLALLADQPGEPPRIALAAPTGKAAARLQEAVRTEAARLSLEDQQRLGPLTASTIHRLLGWRPDRRGRFRHDHTNRLPYDVVVVDETSMVSLTLMSRLVEAVRPEARLILVGDPDQLASVEAGAVLGDLVARPAPSPEELPGGDLPTALLTDLAGADLPPGETADAALRSGTVRLTKLHRFGGTIADLARAVQRGDADEVVGLLRSSPADIAFTETDGLESRIPAGLDELRADVVAAGAALVETARAGDVPGALGALERHRLLCAHREGPYGVTRWSDEVERWLAGAIDGFALDGEWYRGRPLLVTANDYDLQLFNGDTGVVVDAGERGVRAAFGRGTDVLHLAPSRLSGVQTVHAMTVHRSQGSQFDRVSLVLPPAESPLLTRELFYTAITRAKHFVRIVGSEAAVRAAVQRPIVRASGLRRRFS